MRWIMEGMFGIIDSDFVTTYAFVATNDTVLGLQCL